MALTTAALTCCPYALAQEEPSDPGDTPATSEGPIEAGKLVSGIIDLSGDVDVFRVKLASAPAMLDVAVAHTDSTCEIWATLLDSEGSELRTIFVPREGALSLNSIALVAGTYYVAISTGPYVSCSGAKYTLELSLRPLSETGLTNPDPTEMGLTALTWGNAIACSAAREKASRLGIQRRKLQRRYNLAGGATKRRLSRRLAEVTRSYRAAKWEAERACAPSSRPRASVG
ncbi:MAG TPA: hypothetical protein VF056_14740 [Thermoleophilaceae bacterium]